MIKWKDLRIPVYIVYNIVFYVFKINYNNVYNILILWI